MVWITHICIKISILVLGSYFASMQLTPVPLDPLPEFFTVETSWQCTLDCPETGSLQEA